MCTQGQKVQDGAPVQMSLPWGLTPADLHAIHRSAQHAIDQSRREQQMDNDMQEVRTQSYQHNMKIKFVH